MKAPFLALALFCFLLTSLPASAQQPSTSGNAATQDSQFASVAGQVLRAGTGEPLKKSRILLKNDDDNSADPYIAITDAEGRFLIAGIRPGRYSMDVERDGFLSKSYGEDGTGDSSSILSLKPGQQLTDLIFRLQKCGVISGRVLDEDGEPAREVTVDAVIRSTHRGRIGTRGVKAATTNDLGEYRLFDLDPGTYFVSASVEQRGGMTIGKVSVDSSILKSVGGYIPTYYPSSGDTSRASTVEVKAGGEVPGVDIILLRQPSYTVRGQVINAVTDHLLSSFAVELLPAGKDSYSFADMRRTEADRKTGEFEISDVPPGSYRLAAAMQGEQNRFVGVTPVEVVNADVISVRVIITRGADLRGRVVKEGKVAPSTLQVDIRPRDPDTLGGYRSGEAKSDGTFLLIGLPDGLYDISAGAEGCDTCYLKSATVNGTDILDSGLTISAGLAPQPVELVLSDRTGIVDGTVKNNDGSPVTGATVILITEHPHPSEQDNFRRASTDQFGYFSIPGVAPGKYRAFSWKNLDYSDYEDPDFRQPFLPKAPAFALTEDEKKTLQLTLLSSSADTQ